MKAVGAWFGYAHHSYVNGGNVPVAEAGPHPCRDTAACVAAMEVWIRWGHSDEVEGCRPPRAG